MQHKIQVVKRWVTRMIETEKLPYMERLKKLGLLSLESRQDMTR